jgi:hypothetical protein
MAWGWHAVKGRGISRDQTWSRWRRELTIHSHTRNVCSRLGAAPAEQRPLHRKQRRTYPPRYAQEQPGVRRRQRRFSRRGSLADPLVKSDGKLIARG